MWGSPGPVLGAPRLRVLERHIPSNTRVSSAGSSPSLGAQARGDQVPWGSAESFLEEGPMKLCICRDPTCACARGHWLSSLPDLRGEHRCRW